jgi:hypothetical protein
MGMINIVQKGDFSRTVKYMKHAIKEINDTAFLNKYGLQGVQALSAATPKDTGATAKYWRYEIQKERDVIRIGFYNSHMADNVSVAILLQYGHGTGTGGYVQGVDYINPALKPIFESIANEAWKEVIRV